MLRLRRLEHGCICSCTILYKSRAIPSHFNFNCGVQVMTVSDLQSLCQLLCVLIGIHFLSLLFSFQRFSVYIVWFVILSSSSTKYQRPIELRFLSTTVLLHIFKKVNKRQTKKAWILSSNFEDNFARKRRFLKVYKIFVSVLYNSANVEVPTVHPKLLNNP